MTRTSAVAKGDQKKSHGSGAQRNDRHRIIETASQGFLDRPGQVATENRNLFRSLVMDAIPALRSGTPKDEDVEEWYVNSPVEKRLLIARGQQQALRSALTHVVFIELASDILSILESGESLVPPTGEMPQDDEYVGDVIRVPYFGEYHRFMLAGVRWIQRPSFDLIESVKSPDHPYYRLLVAAHSIQLTVRGARAEQQDTRSRTAYQGTIRAHEDLATYRPLFLANLQDVMIPLVAAQKAYLSRRHAEDKRSPQPNEIVRLILANLGTLSLPAFMKREAALKVIPHPVIQYADRPMEDKPFASMRPLLVAVGDAEGLRLAPVPEFGYLQSARRSFCAGLIAHRSSDLRGRETAERLLSAAGAPSGRSPRNPDYGKIDPITILGIVGARIARDTIFRESPFETLISG